MHAVPALPSRATLGCNIPWAVKRLFPLEQELGMMLHWESTGLALGGLQFIKQVRRGSLEGGESGCLLQGWTGFVPSHQHPLRILAPAMCGLLLCPRDRKSVV